jgi:ABC-2 type transport system permease protein
MNPTVIVAIVRKDLLDVIRNRTTLFALLTPLFLAVLYWVMSEALSEDVTTLALYNPGNSTLITQQTLPNNTQWHILPAPSAEAVRTMVDNNEQNAAVGVVLPPDTDAVLRQGGHPAIAVYFHGAKYSDFSQQLFVASLINRGQVVAGQQPLLQVTPVVLRATPEEQAGDRGMSRLAATFGMVTLLVGLLSTGLLLVPHLLVEEKEKKTLRLILSAPASYADVVIGKLLVGLIYTLLLGTFLLLISRIPFAALPQVVYFGLLGGLLFLLCGVLVGIVSKTGVEVNTYGTIIFLLAMVPILFGMPGLNLAQGALGVAVRLIPNFYVVDGMGRALQDTATPDSFLLNTGVTLAVIVALFALSTWSLRRQQLAMG